VNVASECGYTDSHYKALVQLQQDYQGQGFTVLAFPSNQFGEQEPGTNQQIIEFAKENYGADFPIFAKTNVTGDQMCAAYQYLTEDTGSFPSWNFCKYLVDQNGEVVQFFSQKDGFGTIRSSIEYLLRKQSDEL
jgi:glutathione peroxidase